MTLLLGVLMDPYELTNTMQDAFKLAVNMLQHPSDAEDVLHEAAHVALTHKSAPDSSNKEFRPWFFKVLRNKAIDRLRVIQRENNRLETQDYELVENHSSSPEQQIISQQLSEKLNKALSSISIEHREIILLKDMHGFSYSDIAQILGIANGSVMSRLHRARLALKDLMLS